MTRTALASIVLITLAGCGDDGSPVDSSVPVDTGADTAVPDAALDAPVDAARDASGCEMLWTVEDPGTADVAFTVDLGELEIRAVGLPIGPNARVFQSGLVGDFDASVEVAGFEAGFGGFYVQAVLRKADGTEAVAALGSSPEQAVSAGVLTDPPVSDSQPTTETGGTLRFQRAGDMLTVTATAGSDSASVMETFDGELELGIQIGNNGAIPIDDPSRVRVLDFTVAPESTVRSDSFDCDSLIR